MTEDQGVASGVVLLCVHLEPGAEEDAAELARLLDPEETAKRLAAAVPFEEGG